jgi:hypothetical protein
MRQCSYALLVVVEEEEEDVPAEEDAEGLLQDAP